MLLWVVQLFVDRGAENPADNLRWESLFLVLDTAVPADKREDLNQELKDKNEGIWAQVGFHIFGQLVGYVVTLALGSVLHTFFVGA